MSISVCIGYTNRHYGNMARVAARSIMRHTPDVNVRLVRCNNKGYRRNMGTRFDAYVDESADWVLALDADSLCFGDIRPIVQRAEHEGWDFLGRLSGQPRKAPRMFDRPRYDQLFRDAGFDNHYRMRESDDPEINADALQNFLAIGHDKASEIAKTDYLFAD